VSRQHGEHVAGLGYYDAGRRQWLAEPPKSLHNAPDRPRPEFGTFRDDVPSTDELRAKSSSSFARDPRMEKARELRDSDRPEDRDTFRKLPASLRLQLAGYEQQARDVLDGGGRLPKGVRRPPPSDAA
jgi:hypothetical protein